MNAFSLPNLEWEMASHSRILALESSMDRGAWWATVHGVAVTQTLPSTHARSLLPTMLGDLGS